MSLVAVGASSAQPYPSKPIKIVLPLSAGSPIDVMARIGARFVVTSRSTRHCREPAGGGGTIATKAVATAAPDGYTLLFVGLNSRLRAVDVQNLDYDPIKDFAPVATVGIGFVHARCRAICAGKVGEGIDRRYAKANPGKLNWGFGRRPDLTCSGRCL